MTSPKGATPALRLTLPGAPKEWHHFGSIDGLYHPDFAVPLDTLGVSEEQAKQWDKSRSVPLTLESITPGEADAARKAYGGEPVPEEQAAEAPADTHEHPKEG